MSTAHEVEYQYTPHPRVEERAAAGPPTIMDSATPAPDAPRVARFNSWLAIKITSGVGTMWCAYAFAVIALVGLPQAIHDTFSGPDVHPLSLIAWVAQTFLQLVLLSIIIVGQNIQAAGSDARAKATYDDAAAVLEEAKQIQIHLQAQDAKIQAILGRLEDLAAR
jgi:hypothetical protein